MFVGQSSKWFVTQETKVYCFVAKNLTFDRFCIQHKTMTSARTILHQNKLKQSKNMSYTTKQGMQWFKNYVII